VGRIVKDTEELRRIYGDKGLRALKTGLAKKGTTLIDA